MFWPTSWGFLMRYSYFCSFGSSKYKKILSISHWWSTRLSNTVFWLIVLYRWPGIYGHCRLRSCLFSLVTSKLIIIFLSFIFSWHGFIEHLYSLIILCTNFSLADLFSEYTVDSLLNLCWDFNIVLFFSNPGI